MIKPKTKWASAYWSNAISQFGGHLQQWFRKRGKDCALSKFYFYLSPVLRIRKQFYFQVFFFYVSNLYNCFNCRSQSHSFHIFFNFGTFLTWKLQQLRSLSNIYLFLPLWNVTLQKIFSMVWNENKKTKKTRTSCVLSFLLENSHNYDLKLTTFYFLLCFIY